MADTTLAIDHSATGIRLAWWRGQVTGLSTPHAVFIILAGPTTSGTVAYYRMERPAL